MMSFIKMVWKRNQLQPVNIRFIYKLTMMKSSEKDGKNWEIEQLSHSLCNNLFLQQIIFNCSAAFSFSSLYNDHCMCSYTAPTFSFAGMPFFFQKNSIPAFPLMFSFLSLFNCMQCMMISFMTWLSLTGS